LITIETASDLEADWSKTLCEVASWRIKRGGLATIVEIYLTVQRRLVSQVASHVVTVLVANRDRFPSELNGLQVGVAIFDDALSLYLDLKLFPEVHSAVPASAG
jgi:hypothetical protein